MARTLMVQGTASSAGKTLLVAALCRLYARRGLRTAPFKAQNMALNSFVTPDGLELGRAQALQARAAGVEVDVRMNPVLLKPEGDSTSQVVLLGKPWKRVKAGEYWRERSVLWPAVTDSLDSLGKEYDLVVVEGAGSPAEINLKATDIVNMAVARYARAPVLLVGDIDRGGVFASFVGTLALLEEDERDLVAGFVVNKFRGDPELLRPGLDMLRERTGKPTLGVVPWIPDLLLAEEDSVALDAASRAAGARRFGSAPRGTRNGAVEIGVVRFPRISNFDDLDALAMEAGVSLRFVDRADQFGDPDAVILPGSKATLADLEWLKRTGLADRVRRSREGGIPVVGICGGYQMLGRAVEDPDGVESGGPAVAAGLGLLSHRTLFRGTKTLTRTKARIAPGAGAFGTAAGAEVSGYEVHMGVSADVAEAALFDDGSSDPVRLGTRSADGTVWGSYLHGVFDEAPFRRAWLRSFGWVGEGAGESLSARRERELDRLADAAGEALDLKTIDRLLGLDL